MKKRLFLLGGHSLEMLAIRALLDSNKQEYLDANLDWRNARLSSYSGIFQHFLDCGYEFVGVSLVRNFALPNYISITHPERGKEGPAPLEQVATLLGVSLLRREKLIAAYSRWLLPELQAAGATPKEIKELQRQDLIARGVTATDEKLADEAVAKKECESGITIIKSDTNKFTAIYDKLRFLEVINLLIYTEDECIYYGAHRDAVIQEVRRVFPALSTGYSGEDRGGFWGAEHLSKALVENLIQLIKKVNAASDDNLKFTIEAPISQTQV